jgi:hypothetical protein
MKFSGSPHPEKSAPAHSSSPEVGSSGYDETGGVEMRSRVDLKWCPRRSAYALNEVLTEEA